MGQYYKPIILKDNEDTVEKWMYSWDYDNGLKLMEHSYVDNTFVGTFVHQLINKPKRVVWAGDYADNEPNTQGQGYNGEGKNLYDFCTDDNKVQPAEISFDNMKAMYKDYPYLVNHTKKEVVNINRMPKNNDWKIHPLSLLTCEGNMRGGGDYYSKVGQKHVGRWARDLISLEHKKPYNYKLIRPNFTEKYD